RPPWSLYDTCRMRRPMPCGGMTGSDAARAANGAEAAAAIAKRPFRCSRRFMRKILAFEDWRFEDLRIAEREGKNEGRRSCNPWTRSRFGLPAQGTRPP